MHSLNNASAKQIKALSPRTLTAPFALVLIGAAALAFHLTCLNYPIFRCDNVYHLIGAWAMARGDGYADISRPDLPPLLKYPPGYALTLAPFINAVGPHLKWLRVVSILPFIASLPLGYALLRSRVEAHTALTIIAIYAFHPVTLWLLYIMINFGLHVLLFLSIYWATEQIANGQNRSEKNRDQEIRPTSRGRNWPGAPWNAVILGLLLGGGFYVHRMTLCLIAGVITYLCWRGYFRAALIAFVLSALIALPWVLRSHAASGHWLSPEYEAEVVERIQGSAPAQPLSSAIGAHLLQNAPDLPAQFGHYLFPWGQSHLAARLTRSRALSWLPVVSQWGVTLLVLVGWLWECRRRITIAEWYLVWHTGMMLVFFVGFQYFILLAPWLWLYLWRGVQAVAPKLKIQNLNALGWAGGVLLLLTVIAKDKVYWDSRHWPLSDDRDASWSWVTPLVPAGATVYWIDLDNYSWTQWRYFDTARMAIGIPARKVLATLEATPRQIHYLAGPCSPQLQAALLQRGWQLLKPAAQPAASSPAPPPAQAIWFHA